MTKIDDKTKKAFVKLLVKIAIIVVVFYVLLTFVFGVHINHGNNMYPAIKDGDLCITYKLEKYDVGDVVLYCHNGEKSLVRIIAKDEGDVKIDFTGITINGYVPSEEIFYPTVSSDEITYSLRNGELFVLNDFRSDDNDSRHFGLISDKELEGKVIFILRRRGF